jgi:Tol biopolymer transport system component
MRKLTVVVVAFVAPGLGAAVSAGGSIGASPKGGYAPVWSPDGTRIAYIGPAPDLLADPAVAGFTHVFVVSAHGTGAARIVATAPRQQTLGEVRWAAAGSVVYADSNYTLWSSSGHSVKRLGVLGVTGTAGESFSLSRDGRQVAFTAPCDCNVREGNEVRLVPASGGVARALARPKGTLDSDPSFSPDGRWVAFSRVLTTRKAWPPFANELIEIAGVHGRAARSLGVHGGTPAYSPDGRQVAFFGRAGIEIVGVHGGKPRTLLPLRCCNVRAAYSWSPDSRTLAYVTDSRAGTVTLSGTKTVFALSGLHPDLHTPQWSPDGKTIALSAIRNGDDLGYRVYLVGVDGSGLRRIA